MIGAGDGKRALIKGKNTILKIVNILNILNILAGRRGLLPHPATP